MYMTGQKYRRAMEQIELSPDQREHLVRAMLQEQPRRKRKRAPVRLLLAAALACGVLTISVLALSPALREYLTQALGSFAPYSQELSGATAVDQKVKVRVVSAVTDRYRVKLYVELTDLTGERIVDENTRLSAKIQREAGEDGLRSRCVGYDPETCTALFELNGNMEEGGKYQEQMRLRITQVRPQQYHEYTIETQSMAGSLVGGLCADNGAGNRGGGFAPRPDAAEAARAGAGGNLIPGIYGGWDVPHAVPPARGGGPGPRGTGWLLALCGP